LREVRPREKHHTLTDTGGLVLQVKPNGVKAWRCRFKLTAQGVAKESTFAIGDHAMAPRDESLKQAGVAHPSCGGNKAHASRSDLRDRLRRAG
jgi:hypothetical protein